MVSGKLFGIRNSSWRSGKTFSEAEASIIFEATSSADSGETFFKNETQSSKSPSAFVDHSTRYSIFI